MKNSIWVGRNKSGGVYVFTGAKPFVKNGELCGNWYGGAWFADLFELDLKTLEIVELIFDTKTGKVEVMREREIGWYMGFIADRELCSRHASAYHWDGETFAVARAKNHTARLFGANEIVVVSEKITDNEYLKGLE